MATVDTADEIRRRRMELQELGFDSRAVAQELGPEAEEQEFTDRFKEQYLKRQAKLDAGRKQTAADSASRRAMDASIADRAGLMQDLVPPGQLVIPGLDAASADAAATSDDLSIPGLPPTAAPARQPRPALRRPDFLPPNPAQDMMDRRAGASRASAAVPPVAQLARDRQSRRERASAPGGLNVPPERVAADRAAAAQVAATPDPTSAAAELSEREARASESRDIDSYRRARERYDIDHRVWRSALDEAYRSGNDARARELVANEPVPPTPPQAVTGGLAPNEIKAFDSDSNPATPPVAETALQTLSILRDKNPAAYARLQRQAQAAVGTDSEALTEWVSSQFGDLPPAERYEAMLESGQRLIENDSARPRFAAPEGARGGIGTPGRPSGARAPEGRQALDPRTGKPLLIRDPFNSGRSEPIPDRAGGRLKTTRGAVARAPQSQSALGEGGLGIDSLDTFPARPEEMTPQWREQMIGIGTMAFGLDRADFAEGPDGDDMFIAATQKLLEGHQQKVAAGFEATPEVTGGASYRPGQAMRDLRAQRELDNDTDAFLNARPAIAQTEEAAALRSAATPAERRAIKARLVQMDKAERRSALNDTRRMEADQKNRASPARAPGMFRTSLAQAGDNPNAIAAVYRDWGMPAEAERVLAMENERLAIEQQGAVARAKVEAEREKPDFEIAAMAQGQAVDGVIEGTMSHDVASQQVAVASGIYSPGSGRPMTDAERRSGDIALGRLLLGKGVPATHPSVQVAIRAVFHSVRNDQVWRNEDSTSWFGLVNSERAQFRTALRDQLGITDPGEADRLYDQLSATSQ